jgi:nicotinamidase-related amidase
MIKRHRIIHRLRVVSICSISAIFAFLAGRIEASDIIDQWKSVGLPAPPALQPVSVDATRTALLVLDVSADLCTEAKRPYCVQSIDAMKSLLTAARSHKMLVVYAFGPPTLPASTRTPAPLAPIDDEPVVRAGPDKFFNSDLETILAAHDVHSVIVVGTAAQGAILYTVSGAALRGLEVILPVDGYSSDSADRFPELYTAWHLKHASILITPHVTLTRSKLITIR